MEEVNGPTANPREVFDRPLKRILRRVGDRVSRGWGRVDGGPYVGGGEAVQVGVPQQGIDLGARVEEVGDQPTEGREGRPVTVSKPGLIQPEDEIADALRD